jgi:hypothetical protein
MADPVELFDNFRPEALEYLLNAVKVNEERIEKEKSMETDLYANSTNLYSVIERGEEYEAD